MKWPNRYAYVGNRPLSYVDPRGQEAVRVDCPSELAWQCEAERPTVSWWWRLLNWNFSETLTASAECCCEKSHKCRVKFHRVMERPHPVVQNGRVVNVPQTKTYDFAREGTCVKPKPDEPCRYDPLKEQCWYAWRCPPTASERANVENSTWVFACQDCCSRLFTARPGELLGCQESCRRFIPPLANPPIVLPNPAPILIGR